MGEFEAVGEVVTGGMIGRAVEPGAEEPSADGHTHERNCLNCATPLAGDYCHACGQHAHVHRTLTAFFHDLMHGVLHFEGKIWNTLPLLAWQPGELTRRYIDGERARYVSPIAQFLFSVFLMFAAASATGGLTASSASSEDVRQELAKDTAKQEAKIAGLRQARDATLKSGGPTAALDAKIEDEVQDVAAMRGLRSAQVWNNPDFQVSKDIARWLRVPIEKAGKNPDLLFYKLKTNAYKFSWALIPLSVPFVWLLFPFSRRFRLYDHTVFVTYSLSFMTLLVVTALLIGTAGLTAIAGLLFFVPPFHMYRQLKGTYGLGRWSAIIRTIVLLLFTAIALSLFGMTLVALGLFD